ncbi:MAG: dihydropteroate synthase [Salibacteraceae bacterium]
MRFKTENKTLINCHGKLISLEEPKIMGTINLNNDSFYSGSRKQSDLAVLKTVEKMLNEGADFIDLGAYSSKPGAENISTSEELNRIVVINEIVKQFPEAVLSIDTFRAEVASAAINSGAAIINDISGGELDSNMFNLVAKLKVPYIMMHMKGTPQTMKELTNYDDILHDMNRYFSKKINELTQLGVNDVILDPGFGFAKTTEQNFYLLNNLDHFQIFGLPVLAGVSRKSLIYKTLGSTPEQALNGTTVLNTLALNNRAKILRVHDVKEAVEARTLFLAYQKGID